MSGEMTLDEKIKKRKDPVRIAIENPGSIKTETRAEGEKYTKSGLPIKDFTEC